MFRSVGRTLRQGSGSFYTKPRTTLHTRTAITAAQGKKEGTIADAFASLSGQKFEALEPRFAAVKAELINGNEEALNESWNRLLLRLQEEIKIIQQIGSSVVPQIQFTDIDNPSEHFSREYRKRGCAVVKGVVPQEEVLQMKQDLKDYTQANPSTKAFPAHDPQVYELYWSPTQIRARAHPNLLKTQRFLLSYWHSKDPNALISLHPISYADRLRMRRPGDAAFALGPHVDGGSCERWEESGYGKGGVYEQIWKGNWEQYDPWESSCRLPVVSDLYQGQGACSAFRMAQGWLAMSTTSAFEGTLLVNPLLQSATAYFLLRPFFTTKSLPQMTEVNTLDYLSPENWELESPQSSWLHGANPGRGQELSSQLHPHLSLQSTMVHVPTVEPGDYVVWHCDGIHAVDSVHKGLSDSSVMYIPACPLTIENAKYLVRQRDTFLRGLPSPDFPGGVGESNHIGRAAMADVAVAGGQEGLRAMGLERFNVKDETLTAGEKQVMLEANRIFGFNQEV